MINIPQREKGKGATVPNLKRKHAVTCKSKFPLSTDYVLKAACLKQQTDTSLWLRLLGISDWNFVSDSSSCKLICLNEKKQM